MQSISRDDRQTITHRAAEPSNSTHIKVTTLMPIAAAPAAPPPRALLRLLSRISCVVGGAFGGELDMVALLLLRGRRKTGLRRARGGRFVWRLGLERDKATRGRLVASFHKQTMKHASALTTFYEVTTTCVSVSVRVCVCARVCARVFPP